MSDMYNSGDFNKDVYNAENTANAIATSNISGKLGMKWYNFIIYFQLFATCILNILNGMILFSGKQYKDSMGNDISKLVYTTFPKIKSVDYFYGLLLVALALLAIYVRQLLSKMKKNGPSMYFTLYVFSIASALIYVVLASAVTNISLSSLINGRLLLSLVIDVAMLIINIIYFGHRKGMFNN